MNRKLLEEAQAKARLSESLQKHMHELDELHHRKDEFIAMLSHELRNPLAPLSAALELLKINQGSAQSTQQWTAMMERQLKQMERLVDDLLDVSRVLSGKIVLQKQQVDLRDVASHAAEASCTNFKEGGHEFELALPRDAVWVNVDDIRIQQVIINLLNNAAKFTPPGGQITLITTTERDEAILRIIDTGIGISAELLPRVFDIFTQGDTSLDRSQGGLGIGLTLANNLVHLHGGYIQVFSNGKGLGSEFVVRLPLSPPVTNEKTTRDIPPKLDKDRRRHILIVDDNVDMAHSTAEILRLWGHEVRYLHSGLDAINLLHHFKPEVVLLDIGLPGMDGYEIARRIRQCPDMSAMILVGVSGYGADEFRRRAFESGFDEYITKPLDLNNLRNYLNRLPALHEWLAGD